MVESVSDISDISVPAPAGPVVSVPLTQACADLLELLGGVGDGRSDQGRDHPVSVVLALAAAAVVAGMRGYTAITGWVADVPATVLADLYLRAGALPAGPPSKTTIWRVLTDADAALGRWLRGLVGLTAAPGADGCGDSPVVMGGEAGWQDDPRSQGRRGESEAAARGLG